ncbi:three-Cys-motif partner protein TcmP [Nitrogeniibacter mangrovi]|uniref:three-Cys-motif partner protein TcmP n=1 Tax=Nitrogeniibacter mangrovi TaxID=2016596 RepID=UPI001C2D0E74|nr:three-Cys-motif partner protein TcmP [Nitrogeniibacter mangrovi]
MAKHRILKSYMAAYYQTLVGGQPRDEFKLTLVDGFAGGGVYTHADTGKLAYGSPIILLEAEKEAEFFINQGRSKPVRLDIGYFFIESRRNPFLLLKRTLQEKGYGARFGSSIQILKRSFEEIADDIIKKIQKKSPRNGRSIFILDQFGYSAVPTSLIRKILYTLPGAEIILTFAVDSFLNFANDKNFTTSLKKIEIPNILAGRSLREIKASDTQWRLFIQSTLYKELVRQCGAKHYTPFFVRNKQGHGDYWLIHLSQHFRARDVMTEVHWQNQNYFIHYGGAGLNMFDMLGYDPQHDSGLKRQSELGFEFDDVAKESSIEALMAQVPKVIYSHDEGVNYGVLYATTCNESPASSNIYQEAIIKLAQHRVIEIVGTDGKPRRPSKQIGLSDQIIAPSQRPLFFV